MNGAVHFSEIASCQVEFRALSHLTGKPEYVKAVRNYVPKFITGGRFMTIPQQVDKITDHLRSLNVKEGLYPLKYLKSDGSPIGCKYS